MTALERTLVNGAAAACCSRRHSNLRGRVMRLRNSVWACFSLALVTTISFAQQASARLPLNGRNAMDAASYANYGKLPLVFEENQGQANLRTKFLARGRGYTAFLATDGMVLSLRPTHVVPTRRAANVPATSSGPSVLPTAIQVLLSGATRNPAGGAEERH